MNPRRFATVCAAALALGLPMHATPAVADAEPDREWADLFDVHETPGAPVAAATMQGAIGDAAPIVRHDDASRLHAGRRANEELIAWLQAGEQAYRERRADEALQIFQRIVAAEPGLAHAWLRIGNLHQQRRQWFQALSAYRRAATRPGADAGELAQATRRKALHNLAAINLELARQSLREIERLGPIDGSPDTGDMGRIIADAQRQLESLMPSVGRAMPASPRSSSMMESPQSAAPKSIVSKPAALRPGATKPAESKSAESKSAEPKPASLGIEAARVDYIRGQPGR